MRVDCFVALVGKNFPLTVRKAVVNPESLQGHCKLGWRSSIDFVIPKEVSPVPFGFGRGRKSSLYFCDLDKLTCFNMGAVTGGLSEEDKSLLRLLGRDKVWQFMGGRGLALLEYLLIMGAGYGFLRLVEVLILRR